MSSEKSRASVTLCVACPAVGLKVQHAGRKSQTARKTGISLSAAAFGNDTGGASRENLERVCVSPITAETGLEIMRRKRSGGKLRCGGFLLSHVAVFCLRVAAGLSAADLAAGDEFPAAALRALVQEHCQACHDPVTRSGGLNLDVTATDLSDESVYGLWQHVHDRVQSDQMPPAESRQSWTAADRDRLLSLLSGPLQQASLDRQRQDGRALLRRLTAFEYENTLSDLLGERISVAEVLPEDVPRGGFENQSGSLDLSAVHFLKYQEAAARVIRGVVPISPQIPFSDERSGRVMTEKGPNFREGLGRTCRLDGDSLIFYTQLPRYGLCATAAVPAAGRYRIRMQAAAVGDGVQSIPVGLMRVLQSGREGPELYDVVDIPAGDPQVLEFECELAPRQAFVVNLLTYWDIRRFKRPIEEYTGAGLRVDWLKLEGPIGEWPGPGYRELFGDLPLRARSVVKAEAAGGRVPVIRENRPIQQWESDPLVPVSGDPRGDSERLLKRFLGRALRRPATAAEESELIAAVQAKLEAGATFFEAMLHGYQLLLTSPGFLLLLDSEPGSPLDDYELASRLSYFLWCSCPDEQLLQAAAGGRLRDEAGRREQVERMLGSPKLRRFTTSFTGQWLDLRRIQATLPDPALYPDFDPLLLWSMQRETELFFEEVLRTNASVLEFVDSDWSMLNERLGQQYGIGGLRGSVPVRTALPADSVRGGVLTQAAVLKVTADGTRTSPVLRGAWVLDRLLGTPPTPPPPNIPPIEPDIRGATTIREQLAAHRNTPACATCHNQIDPPGFALECFDPIGNYREFYRVTVKTEAGALELPYRSGRPVYRGPAVDASGQFADGRQFSGIRDYRRMLLDQRRQLVRNVVQRVLEFSTSAKVQFADRAILSEMVDRLEADGSGFRSVIHEVVNSRPFLWK